MSANFSKAIFRDLLTTLAFWWASNQAKEGKGVNAPETWYTYKGVTTGYRIAIKFEIEKK